MNKTLVVCMVISLIIGYILGIRVMSSKSAMPSDKIADYIDSELETFPGIWGRTGLTDRATLGDLKEQYYRWQPSSTRILITMLKGVCDKTEWENVGYEIPSISSITNDTCTELCGCGIQ